MWLEAILVSVIVLVAACYALWALLPRAVRLRLAQAVGTWGRQPGRSRWLTRATAALERAARARHGGCSECSAVQDAPKPPGSRPQD